MALFRTKKNKDIKKDDAKAASEKKAQKETAKDVSGSEQSMKDLYSEEAVKKSARDKKKKVSSRYEGAFRVLIKPLVTEKATELVSQNKYSFVVNDSANKIEVSKAVYAVYGVKPLGVNIVSMKGKAVSRGKIKGKRKDWKKAIVTLKKGETIQIYEGV